MERMVRRLSQVDGGHLGALMLIPSSLHRPLAASVRELVSTVLCIDSMFGNGPPCVYAFLKLNGQFRVLLQWR